MSKDASENVEGEKGLMMKMNTPPQHKLSGDSVALAS